MLDDFARALSWLKAASLATSVSHPAREASIFSNSGAMRPTNASASTPGIEAKTPVMRVSGLAGAVSRECSASIDAEFPQPPARMQAK